MPIEEEYRYLIRRAIKDKLPMLARTLAQWAEDHYGLAMMCEITGSAADTLASESQVAPHKTKER